MRISALLVFVLLTGCASSGTTPDTAKMAEGYYMKGLSHLQENNYELALVEFQRSVQTDSRNKMSYYALGIVNDTQGKLKDAVQYYNKAIDIDANFSEAHNALGVVFSKQQKYNEALKSFNKALENKLYSTPHLPHINIGDLYMAQKDYNKAVEAYRESKRYVVLELTIFKLGTALFEAGRIKEAVAEFQEGAALSPKNASMRYSLALALLKDGNKKSSLDEFKKTVELAPGSPIAEKARDYIKTLR